jgi:hypothetical protein
LKGGDAVNKDPGFTIAEEELSDVQQVAAATTPQCAKQFAEMEALIEKSQAIIAAMKRVLGAQKNPRPKSQ